MNYFLDCNPFSILKQFDKWFEWTMISVELEFHMTKWTSLCESIEVIDEHQ